MRYERRLLQALLGVVIGAGPLAAGAPARRVYLETAGVVIVLLSLVWAVVSWRRHVARVRPAHSRAGTTTAKEDGDQKRPVYPARLPENAAGIR